VSHIAFKRRQAKTVRELRHEQTVRDSKIPNGSYTNGGIMVTGMPVVKEADKTWRLYSGQNAWVS
jgi:hypothetical protein